MSPTPRTYSGRQAARLGRRIGCQPAIPESHLARHTRHRKCRASSRYLPAGTRATALRTHRSRRRQQGQALIFGMFVLVVVAMLTFFQFSTGQVTVAKNRLVNATDAAAYSAGLWHARAMNYYAYSNRAIIANEVAIAQAATMVSFAKYIAVFVDKVEDVARYIKPIEPFVKALEEVTDLASKLTRSVALIESIGRTSYNAALSASQEGMFMMTGAFMTGTLATEVGLQTDKRFFIHALPENVVGYLQFTKRYEGKDRQRLKELINRSLDPYSKDHSSVVDLKLPGLKIVRQGQTQLIRDHDTGSFDRWQSYDTMSLHRKRRVFFGRSHETRPLGWGGAEIADEAKGTLDDIRDRRADGAKRKNTNAYRRASRDEFWSNGFYLGVPSVRELDYESQALRNNKFFPTLSLGVVGRLSSDASMDTAADVGLGAGRLKLDDPKPASTSGKLFALSRAEVYFRKPPGAGSRIEYASLYSPYWQVRLTPVPDAWRAYVAARYR